LAHITLLRDDQEEETVTHASWLQRMIDKNEFIFKRNN